MLLWLLSLFEADRRLATVEMDVETTVGDWKTVDAGDGADGEEGSRPAVVASSLSLSLSEDFEVLDAEDFGLKDSAEAVLCGSFSKDIGEDNTDAAVADGDKTILGSFTEFQTIDDVPVFPGCTGSEEGQIDGSLLEQDLDELTSERSSRPVVVVVVEGCTDGLSCDELSGGEISNDCALLPVVDVKLLDPLSVFVREQEAAAQKNGAEDEQRRTNGQDHQTTLVPKLFQRDSSQIRLRKNRQASAISDAAVENIPDEIFKSAITSKQRIFKVIIVGDTNVGKTCLALRFCIGSFPDKVEATIGVDFREKSIQIAGDTIKLQLWDTAGQERFRKSMVPHYYRNASAVVFVYDVTKRSSFDSLPGWIEECNGYNIGKDIPRILIGNKCDLYDQIVIRTTFAQQFADFHRMPLFETSAKTNSDSDNVESIFLTLAYKLKCCRPWMRVPRTCGYMHSGRSTVYLSMDAPTRQGSDESFCGCFK